MKKLLGFIAIFSFLNFLSYGKENAGQINDTVLHLINGLELPAKVDFEVESADITSLARELRKTFGIRICLECKPLDREAMGITVRQQYYELSNKKTPLSEIETTQLKVATEAMEKVPEAIIDWRVKKYSFSFKNMAPSYILSEIFNRVEEYNIEYDNSYLIIYPSENSLLRNSRVGDIELVDLDLKEALSRLNLDKFHIEYSDGPIQKVRIRHDPLKSKIRHLKISQGTLLEVLNRLGQATNPPLQWILTGGTEKRKLLYF